MNMSTDKTEKLSLMTELIKLARADQEVREAEHQFLMAIALQLQITPEDFKALFEQYIDFTPPQNEFDRILQLQRLILLSNVDLQNNEKEIAFIKEVGINMGLNPMAVDEVLNRMHDYENKIIPPDKLIEIFTRSYN
ncbi:MAG: TerB family tellurite resistance protein [Bacteroidota bacterium]